MAIRTFSEKFLVAFSFAGEQREFVRPIAEAVERALGRSTVFFDEWYEHHIAGHDADLKLQGIYSEGCSLAVVCISEHYGKKPWTLAEHEAVRARHMKARASNGKYEIFPIRVGDGEVEGILFNTIVPDVRTRNTEDIAQLIINRLRLFCPQVAGEQFESSGGPSWPVIPPLLHWPIANQSDVRETFSRLLICAAPWRYLAIRGFSESGKSLITRQMLANALRLPELSGLACGRFDFKGTTDIDPEIRAFAQHLSVPLPPTSPRLHERLSHILVTLKGYAKPALLIFDTYEAASTEAQDWIEKELLPCIIRASWLRVVITGQRVPERLGAAWDPEASPVINLKSPPAADWFEYGRQHKPDLTMAFVTEVCALAGDRAGILSQLLGPST